MLSCHPGELLREVVLPAMEEDHSSIARRLGLRVSELDELLAGRRSVEPALAARLGKMFGNSVEFWLNLQAHFDAPQG
jgi:addiction module HigA family antidote